MNFLRANQLGVVRAGASVQSKRYFYGDVAFNKKYFNKIPWKEAIMTETLPDGRVIESLDPNKIPHLKKEAHDLWMTDNWLQGAHHYREQIAHHAESYKTWRLASLTLVPVCLIISLTISLMVDIGHHKEDRPAFVAYDHLRCRHAVHPYFWDPTNTRSMMHNPVHNALPDGYETPAEAKHEHKVMGVLPNSWFGLDHHEEKH